MSFDDLRAATDEELMAAHDDVTRSQDPGGSYYLIELHRRNIASAMQACCELAERAFWLTIANTLLAVVSVAIAIAAILLMR